MSELNRIHSPRNQRTRVQTEHRWDPKSQRREEQRDLINVLGQLQITPGGFVF